MTAFALAFGYYADKVFKQKRAVENLKAAGCQIRFDHEISGSAYPVKPFAPRWIREVVGDDWASRVAYVQFHKTEDGPRFTDDDAQYLRSLPHLRFLWLDSSEISDEGAATIGEMKDLKFLLLARTRISDAGLPHIVQAKGLEFLDLSETNITDAGITDLTTLESLTDLSLDHTHVTDQGIRKLPVLKKLESLGLWFTQVTDDAVRELAADLPNCEIYHGAAPERPD